MQTLIYLNIEKGNNNNNKEARNIIEDDLKNNLKSILKKKLTANAEAVAPIRPKRKTPQSLMSCTFWFSRSPPSSFISQTKHQKKNQIQNQKNRIQTNSDHDQFC